MALIIAYFSVVLIWATTPLAIQWSSESVGFLFGISARFILAALIAIAIASLLGKRLSLSRPAIYTYLAGGLGMSVALFLVYWGSLYIPSGWVSLLFGLSPVMTALIAQQILNEKGLTTFRFIAFAISLIGLFIMLETAGAYDENAVLGILAITLSVLFYSISLVTIKYIDADIDSFSSVTGTVIVSAILFSVICVIYGVHLPEEIPLRTGISIIYLAIIGSILGFLMFYYVLKRVEATKTALISLITPGCSLLLGYYANNEPLNWSVISGGILILLGLLLFEFEVAIKHKMKLQLLGEKT